MNFSEQPPSKQWAALTFRGERIADVWFKPEDDPSCLVFRIPQSSFDIPDIGQRLTMENLLKAVAIATDDVESWRSGGDAVSAADASCPALSNPLPRPADGATDLEVRVRMKPPRAADQPENREPEIAPDWSELEARWKALLGLEASVITLRRSAEGLRAELEASMRRMLTADEKVYALAADVVEWNKAKNRAHYALPRAGEFIHRATWADGTPERKRLGEIFKNPVATQTSLPPAREVMEELDSLRKERQVLSAKGAAVVQECKAIAADIQRALRTLQTNAASKMSFKKGGTGAKGKSF